MSAGLPSPPSQGRTLAPRPALRYCDAGRPRRRPGSRGFNVGPLLTDKQFERALSIVDDADALLAMLEREIDAHTTGTDPVRHLHGVPLAAYRKDPRVVRMFRKAGFDADGKLP